MKDLRALWQGEIQVLVVAHCKITRHLWNITRCAFHTAITLHTKSTGFNLPLKRLRDKFGLNVFSDDIVKKIVIKNPENND